MKSNVFELKSHFWFLLLFTRQRRSWLVLKPSDHLVAHGSQLVVSPQVLSGAQKCSAASWCLVQWSSCDSHSRTWCLCRLLLPEPYRQPCLCAIWCVVHLESGSFLRCTPLCGKEDCVCVRSIPGERRAPRPQAHPRVIQKSVALVFHS